jgi:Zn-dependent protease with chaperone function
VEATEYAEPPVDERTMGAGTTLRFALLVVLLLASSSAMIVSVVANVTGATDNGCMFAAGADPYAGTFQIVLATEAQPDAFAACMARGASWPPPWAVVIAWLALLIPTAMAVFFALPVWKARRGRVVPLDQVDPGGDLHHLLASVMSVTGLTREPRVVVDPTASSIGAVVFGRNSRPTVCLHGGLLARRRCDQASLQAVLLHELAHIRNGDVTVTYVTVAVWRAFLAVVLLPFAASTVVEMVGWLRSGAGPDNDPSLLTRSLLVIPFTIVLVYLARSDVLRSREIYADLAAVRWGAHPNHWVITTSIPVRGRLSKVLHSFAELWLTHPRWNLRRDALSDPSTLFGLPALPMFLTGAAATLINAQIMVAQTSYGLVGGCWEFSSSVLPAGLIAGVAGIALWRATVYAALTNRQVPAGLRVGAWLGFGMIAGEFVANRIAVFEWLPVHPEILVLVLVAGMAFACWVTQCARLWVDACRSPTSRVPMVVCLAAAGVALTSWFAWWQGEGVLLGWGTTYRVASEGQLIEQAFPGPVGQHPASIIAALYPVLTGIVDQPLIAIAVTALWVVPLLAVVIHTTNLTPRSAPGARRNPSINNDTMERPPVQLVRALFPGLFGGILCWACVVAVQAYMHTWPEAAKRPPGLFMLNLGTWLLVALIAATGVATLWGSSLVTRYRLLAALIAAETAALVGLFGMYALLLLDGCIPPLNTVRSTCAPQPVLTWMIFEYLVTPGIVLPALLAIAAAAVVAGSDTLRHRKTRAQQSESPSRGPLPCHRAIMTRLLVAILCVAATGVAVTCQAIQIRLDQPSEQQTLTGQNALPIVDDASVSPRMRANQLVAWLKNGGSDLGLRFGNDINSIGSAVKEDPASVLNGQSGAPQVRTACIDLGQFAHDAGNYFRIPETELQKQWQTILTQSGKASTDCAKALTQRNDDLFATSITELSQAAATGDSFAKQLSTEISQNLPGNNPEPRSDQQRPTTTGR